MTRAQQATVLATTRPAWRPTLWLLLASMTAMAGLYTYTQQRHMAIPLMTIAIGLSYLIPYRLSRTGPARWIIRGCLLAMLLLLAPDRTQMRSFWYVDEGVTSLLGMLAAAELMLQHWLGRPDAPRQGIMLVLCAAIFAASTNAREPRLTYILAPLFALAAIGSLRVFSPQQQQAPTTAPLRRGMKSRLFKGAAVAFALLVGFSTAASIESMRNRLNRIGAEWLMSFAPRTSVGMSSSSQLSTRFNVTPSLTRALRIRGTRTTMHLRGMVFDTYESGTWRPKLEQRIMESLPVGFIPPPQAKLFQIDRLEDNLSLLYLPLNLASLQADQNARVDVERGHRGVITCTPEAGDECVYQVAPGESLNSQGPLCRPLTPDERAACLLVPPQVDPKVRDLALPLKKPKPLQTMVSIAAYLQANHSYSLKADMGEGDPISVFLLNPKRPAAHCQFFASSVVMLLRSCGIPARYITGYYAHEPTSDGGLVVRQRDGHAWAEAWIDGIGWMTVDATPGGGQPGSREEDESVSNWQKWREWFSDSFSTISNFLRRLNWRQVALAGGLVALVALTVQSILAARKRVRPLPPTPYAFPGDDLESLAMDFNRWLGRMGETPLDSATWMEHLTSQAEQTSARRQHKRTQVDTARDFVTAYNCTRFGDPTDPAAIAQLRQLLDKMKET